MTLRELLAEAEPQVDSPDYRYVTGTIEGEEYTTALREERREFGFEDSDRPAGSSRAAPGGE